MNLHEAIVSPDTRFTDGEDRFRVWGLIEGVLHVMAFTMRGETVRVIFLRKANLKENMLYAQE